jgi:hypothetical protein
VASWELGWELSSLQQELAFKEKATTDSYEQIIELCNST